MTHNKFFISLVLAIFVLLALVSIFLFINKAPSLASEEEIIEIVQTQFEGSKIHSVNQQGNVYTILIDHNLGDYEIIINGETNEILSLRLLALREDDIDEVDDAPARNVVDDEMADEPVASMLTEQQAIEIALREVEGKIDDVELEGEDGLLVYEVEIEVDDDHEATIIINAYTGEIISVTWD
ncbi:PepSY domain-containing protein [Alkalihalobacterium elongatum]|uniref:PepSY domain-containing protein n=1 Tax=Alkalihalobacterium elongatum TaxID=2675466 RepID=UPI001C1F4C14|nr:PepSY domain-containing protein [Alkalihalobacterium elongatum]